MAGPLFRLSRLPLRRRVRQPLGCDMGGADKPELPSGRADAIRGDPQRLEAAHEGGCRRGLKLKPMRARRLSERGAPILTHAAECFT